MLVNASVDFVEPLIFKNKHTSVPFTFNLLELKMPYGEIDFH